MHPNAKGYFLLADAYYEVLEQRGVFGTVSESVTREEAMRDMPITAVDRLLAARAVSEIRAGFPFRPERIEVPYSPPRDPVEVIAKQLYDDPASWLAAMESLLQHHLRAGRVRDAAVVARITAQALPAEAAPNYSAASLMLKLGEHRRAKKYLARSLQAAPEDPATLELLARTELLLEARPKPLP